MMLPNMINLSHLVSITATTFLLHDAHISVKIKSALNNHVSTINCGCLTSRPCHYSFSWPHVIAWQCPLSVPAEAAVTWLDVQTPLQAGRDLAWSQQVSWPLVSGSGGLGSGLSAGTP